MNILFVHNTDNTFVNRLMETLSTKYKLYPIFPNYRSPLFVINLFINAKKSDLLWSEFISYHTFILHIINLFLKKEMLIHTHGYETRVKGIKKILFKLLLTKADYVVCPSYYMQKKIKDIYGVSADVIRNPLPSKEKSQPMKYSLIIASHTPNKKIIESIDYFLENEKEDGKKMIVITPYGNKKYLVKIKKYIKKNSLDDIIELIPYNFDSIEKRGVLSLLLKNCDELILLSDNEGLNVSLTEARLFDKKTIISQIEPNVEAIETNITKFSKHNVLNDYTNLIKNNEN